MQKDVDIAKRFRFREFPVYKDARLFIRDVKCIGRQHFPKEETFGLLSQLCRAADSILLNIAEGADRSSDKDFAHFLNNSHTSLNEVVACLDSAIDSGYISSELQIEYLQRAAELAGQLTAFRKNLLQFLKK